MRFLTFLFVMGIVYSNCSGQNNIDEKKAIAMLKEFYTAHNKNESMIKSLPPKVYVWRSDSLQKKYCTLEMRNKVKHYSENGIDFLTQDEGIDSESIKTMTIVKELATKNRYTVSYDFLDSNYPKTPVKRHVVLHVGVIAESKNYKIASVSLK